MLLDGNLSQAQIAEHLGVSQAALCHWKRQLDTHQQELASLAARRSPGTPGKLSEKQWQQLLKLLAQGATKAVGYQTDRWTLSRIREVIVRRWSVRLSTVQIRNHLRAHGWSPQKP